MDRTYTYFKGEKDKDFAIASMKKYVEQKQELDKFLESLIAPLIEGKQLSILDACCGIGHLVYFLWNLSPQSSFLGVDQTPYLIEQAKELCRDRENISFEVGDVYDLPAKYPKYFDISINWKTISWLPYYDRMLQTLVAVTKRHIFLSSLFYDGDIDFEIRVREFKKEAGKDGFNSYYNVYSFPHFREFVYGLGVRDIQAHDFEIAIDIPRPPLDQMGTYTVRVEDGKRLQISGAVVMSWKVIRIDL
jgi:ubiquinone/menaquinone biosynthesis C-methylase UbiE